MVCNQSGRNAIVVNPPPKKNKYVASTDEAIAIFFVPRRIVPKIAPIPEAHNPVDRKSAARAGQWFVGGEIVPVSMQIITAGMSTASEASSPPSNRPATKTQEDIGARARRRAVPRS